MIYFTSDTHFGHKNIVHLCNRPFASVVEMDAHILDAINSKVSAGDTLYVLGDFAYRGRSPQHYLERIHCQDVRLLLGNHDKRSKCVVMPKGCAGFTSVCDVVEISVGTQRIWMSHYAHRSWPASHRGSWHLYGHSHGSLNDDDVTRGLAALDVGVDNCVRYGLPFGAPWSVAEIAKTLPRSKNEQESINNKR